MKTFRILLFAAFYAVTGILSAHADNLTATSWLVTVDGEARTRTIVIATTNPKADGSLELKATYGFTGGNMYPVQAEISQSASPRQLTLITPADTKIIATERSDGSFQGTFVLKDGRVKGIVIAKLAGDLPVAVKPAAAGAPQKPGPEVPAECSVYYGHWVGSWNQGGFGDVYLRVDEVRSTSEGCMARYSYSTSKTPVPARATVEIKDGTITFVCNKTTGGTCVFKRKNDVLWASYSNPAGGSNSGTFKRAE